MTILALMIPMALILGFGFLTAFFFAIEYGQFDDLETPAHRILFDDIEDKKGKVK